MAAEVTSLSNVSNVANVSKASKLLPRRFGRYTLFDFIGKGGMAEIFLARAQTELGAARLCVVKQILPELAKNPQFAEMLTHEAKLSARLNHANIVQVFDLGRADDRVFIAMDYVEGFDLNDLLRRCTKGRIALPLEFALRIVADALRGLDYAHRRSDDNGKPLGIVHRDVSPSNILVSFDGEVKLCDFGIAHANDVMAQSSSLLDEKLAGKAGYMSPEHARGERIDARADVFAIGIVLWELLSGRRMYKADASRGPLLQQARSAQIPPLVSRDLPNESDLFGIVSKALAIKPDDRFVSAQAMLRELEGYMAKARMLANELKFGEWLIEHFGSEIIAQRRMRERVISPVEHEPAVRVTVLGRKEPEETPDAEPAALAHPTIPDADEVASGPLSAPLALPAVQSSAVDTAAKPSNLRYVAIVGVLALVALLVVAALFLTK